MNTKMKVFGVVLLAALGATACQKGEAADAPSISTAVAAKGDLNITVEANGTVQPVDSVQVKSKASGQILKLYVDVGDSVSAGQLLAQIDPRDVNNNFAQAEANLEVAKAQVENTKAQLDRSRELLDAGVITQQEYDTNNLNYVTAKSSMVRAQTNYDLAKIELNDVTITAPISGTIIDRNVAVGSVIQSGSSGFSGGTTMFTLANLDSMQIQTLVDETDVGKLKPGLTATVKVEAYPSRVFEGIVKKIEPQAVTQQSVTMFNVIVSLDNQSRLLLPGMNGDVTILVNQASNVLLIPNNALVQPQDVGPAALALGLNTDSLNFRELMRDARGGNRGSAAGNGQARRTSFRGQGGAPSRSAQDGQGSFGANLPDSVRVEFDSLRAKVARGEISRDSMRAVFQKLRPEMGGGGREGAPADQSEAGTRSAVVFVMSHGKPQPKLIRVGLNDWDYTEVLEGLNPGDSLAVIGAAQLQAQQQAFQNRIRNRAGGMFGGGGPRGR